MGYIRIGQLADQTGASVETLRYYEAQSLIPEPRRSDAGYRLYTDQDVRRVSFVLRARAMGFSLRETAELLSLQVDKAASTCGEVKELAEQKLTDIDAKIAELNRMKSALRQVTEACAGGEETALNCTILSALEEN